LGDIINRAELTAITFTLDLYQDSFQLCILTDSAFSINTIRNFIIDPSNYKHHPHRELLLKANNLIQTRDQLGLTTHIGKVKSHIGVTHNDATDAGARGIVDGDILPDITYTDVDPPSAAYEHGPYYATPNPTTPPPRPNYHISTRVFGKPFVNIAILP